MRDALTRGARGAAVTVAGQALKVILQFGSVVILSRLLLPVDFGLMAMVAVFVGLGELIRDFGMTLIGLQRKHLSRQQASNLFWLNTGLGLATGGLLAASAGLLASLFGEPRLLSIVPAIAPILLLNGMAAQIRVQLLRSMRFVVMVGVEIAGQVLVLGVTIVLAIQGLGYWSLVNASLVGAAFGLIAPWVATRWLPTRPRRDGTSRQLFKDGAAFGIAHSIGFISSNIDTVVIGVRWNTATVGLYNRGYQLLTLPVQQLMGPLTQVVIPTVHRAVDEGRTVESVLMRVQFGLGFVIIWLFAVTGATADLLIPFVLGAEWQPVVPIFQALAFGGFFWAFSQANYWRVIVENHGRHLVHLNLVTKSITSVLIVAGSFVSVSAVAWAVTAGFAMTWPLALVWFHRVAQWDSWKQFKNGMRLVVPGILATLGGLAVVDHSLNAPAAIVGPVAALVVTAIYLVGVLVVPGGAREARMVLNMALALIPSRQPNQPDPSLT